MNQVRPDISSVIERTFHLRSSAGTGTAFVIEFNGEQFLVTARHNVTKTANFSELDDVRPRQIIRLYFDESREGVGEIIAPVEQIAVGCGDPDNGGVDVAVLKLSEGLEFDSESPALGRPEDLFVTQHVAMSTTEFWLAFGTGFVIVTRTGTIAKIVKPGHRTSLTGDLLVEIEAYPGFSGSPIMYWDEKRQARPAGVAARFSWRTMQTFGPNPVHSGFIGCFRIQHALDLIWTMADA